MYTALIRETVKLDKEAREIVKALQQEKENIQERVKLDEQKAIAKYKQEIEDAVKKAQSSYEKEIEEKKINEKAKFDIMCDQIKKAFDEKQETWIESIYQACIK